MENINLNNITTERLSVPPFHEKELRVFILRLDKVHPIISGNKWFKLKYHLEEALSLEKKTLVTFGGAWSNHIHATAAACKINKLEAIGIIRGEKAGTLSTTLTQAKDLGMKLIFQDREEYRKKRVPEDMSTGDYYLVNEGGYGEKGASGAATILQYCQEQDFSHICCAVGTGTMTAGLINSSETSTRIVGISVMKNNMALSAEVKKLLIDPAKEFDIIHDYHFGGYAKKTTELIAFMNEFYTHTGIPTDFVYTGKLCFAISDLARKNYFPPGSKILLIHSGGLQGNQSLGKGTLIF